MLLSQYAREWWTPSFLRLVSRRLSVFGSQLGGAGRDAQSFTSTTTNTEPHYLTRKTRLLSPQEARLRKALDSLAQDLLNLSQYLTDKNARLQRLRHLESMTRQQSLRSGTKKAKPTLPLKPHDITQAIQSINREIHHARHRNIPLTSQYVVLKRLHGRLHVPRVSERHDSDESESSWEFSNSALNALLALPDRPILDDLAIHLLTSNLPFSEESFVIIIKQLSRLRFESAARSAYHHLAVAGYSPANPLAISLMLKLAISTGHRAEFDDVQRLINEFEVQPDPFIYAILIDGCVKFGMRAKAVQYLRKMMADGAVPSLPALTSILRDCGSRRDWALGRIVWRAMEVGQLTNNFEIDAWAYNAMWTLCNRCENHDLASQIVLAAAKQGFDRDHILRCWRGNSKPLPIRASNKFPTISHIQHAYCRLSSESKGAVQSINRMKKPPLRLLPSTVPRINRPLIAPLSYGPLQSKIQSQLDGILLHKYRKLSQNLEYMKACLLRIESTEPLINSRFINSPQSRLSSESDAELLEDAVREDTDLYLSSLESSGRAFNRTFDNFDDLPDCSPISDNSVASPTQSCRQMDRNLPTNAFRVLNEGYDNLSEREVEELMIERDLEVRH